MNKLLRSRAALAALLLTPLSSLAAIHEIPITTKSADARLAFIAGQAAIDRGDATQANELFHLAVATDPDFTYAWFNLSNVAFSTEEFNGALKGGERGAAAASEGERMLLEFNKLFMANEFNAQVALAKKLTEKYPDSPRAWMVLAGAHGAVNQFAEQRAVLEKVIALAPGFAPAPLALGASWLFNDPKDFTKAEKNYRLAIADDPGSDTYYWSLGDVYRGSNRLEDARRYYELALKIDPNDPTAPMKLGHINSFLGNYDQARKDFDRGIEAGGAANKQFLAPFKALTWVYQGDPKAAIQALEKIAAEIDGYGAAPDQRLGAKVAALTTAATVAMYNSMPDDAQRILESRAQLMRDNAKGVGTEAFSNIQETQIAFFDGQAAAWRGDYKAVAAAVKKISQLVAKEDNPRKMEPYHEVLGLSELRRKNYAKAVTELRAADLTQLHVKYQLAQALEGAGQKDEALKLYREVSVNNFNTVDFALLRKDALKKVG